MMLNFMYKDCCVSRKQYEYTDGREDWIHKCYIKVETRKCSFQICIESKACITCSQHFQQGFSRLFYHIWSIINPCSTFFSPSELFSAVVHLLGSLIPLQRSALQLICPSNSECCKARCEKITRSQSQRAVCQQQCWLCKDGAKLFRCHNCIWIVK